MIGAWRYFRSVGTVQYLFCGQLQYKSLVFGTKPLWGVVMSYADCVCFVVSSAVPSVSNAALQNTGLQLSGNVWKCCSNSDTLCCSTNSIMAVDRMMLPPFVPCMWGRRCSGILACVQICASWEILICLFHSLHPLTSHTSGCMHWIKVTSVHGIPLPPPIRTLSVCWGWLAGSLLQDVGSWGLRQPRRPAAGEQVSGWSACSWGLLSSQGLAWFMW